MLKRNPPRVGCLCDLEWVSSFMSRVRMKSSINQNNRILGAKHPNAFFLKINIIFYIFHSFSSHNPQRGKPCLSIVLGVWLRLLSKMWFLKKKDSTIFYLLQFFVLSWSFGSCWISNGINNNGVEHHNGNEHGKATCDNFAKFIYFQECIVAWVIKTINPCCLFINGLIVVRP